MSYPQHREEMAARGSNSGAAQRAYTPVSPGGSTGAPQYQREPAYDTVQQRRGRSGCCGVFQRIGNFGIAIVHKVVPPGGILSSAFNLASASIGAGILGLPSASDSAGLVLAMIYLLIITYLSVFSMYILALAAQSTRIKSFEGMGRWLFPYGNYAFSYVAAFIRWFHAFAACVAYVISVGNCFGAIFSDSETRFPGNKAIEFLSSKQGNRVLTVVVWLCVMLPMIVPKHIDSLRYASAIAVTFMVYFVIVVVIHSCRHGLPENIHHVQLSGNQEHDDELTENTVFLFRTGNSVIHSVGVFMFAYVCQINAYEVFWDFRPEIRTTRNYTWSAFIGMLLCGTLYVLVCVFGYFDFGSKNLLGKSLLLMFHPMEEADVMIAYVGVLIKLCVAYALLMIAARNSLYYLIGFQHKYRNRPERASAAASSSSNASLAERREGAAADAAMMKPTMASAAAAGAADTAVPELDANGDAVDDYAYAADKRDPALYGGADARLTADDEDKEFVDNTAEDTSYIDNIPFWQHLIVVMILAVASLLCGLFIPNINTVFGFAGAISGACMAFVFPALFFMYSGNFSLAQVGWFTYLNTYALLLCGVIGIVWGTCGTIYETI